MLWTEESKKVGEQSIENHFSFYILHYACYILQFVFYLEWKKNVTDGVTEIARDYVAKNTWFEYDVAVVSSFWTNNEMCKLRTFKAIGSEHRRKIIKFYMPGKSSNKGGKKLS